MADLLLAQSELGSGLGRGAQLEPPQVAVRPALVVEAGDRLLADVAALGEADRGIDDPGLGRHRLGAHLGAEPRGSGLDPDDLDCVLADLDGAGRRGRARAAVGVAAAASRSTPSVVPPR